MMANNNPSRRWVSDQCWARAICCKSNVVVPTPEVADEKFMPSYPDWRIRCQLQQPMSPRGRDPEAPRATTTRKEYLMPMRAYVLRFEARWQTRLTEHTQLVKVTQQLMETLVGKAGFAQSKAPMTAVLRQLENVMDVSTSVPSRPDMDARLCSDLSFSA